MQQCSNQRDPKLDSNSMARSASLSSMCCSSFSKCCGSSSCSSAVCCQQPLVTSSRQWTAQYPSVACSRRMVQQAVVLTRCCWVVRHAEAHCQLVVAQGLLALLHQHTQTAAAVAGSALCLWLVLLPQGCVRHMLLATLRKLLLVWSAQQYLGQWLRCHLHPVKANLP